MEIGKGMEGEKMVIFWFQNQSPNPWWLSFLMFSSLNPWKRNVSLAVPVFCYNASINIIIQRGNEIIIPQRVENTMHHKEGSFGEYQFDALPWLWLLFQKEEVESDQLHQWDYHWMHACNRNVDLVGMVGFWWFNFAIHPIHNLFELCFNCQNISLSSLNLMKSQLYKGFGI